MARVLGYLLALFFVFSSISAGALIRFRIVDTGLINEIMPSVPIESRQLGDGDCRAARVETVVGLRQTSKAVNRLTSSTDPAVVNAATTAQGGLQNATDGITAITDAFLTGQDPPVGARLQIAQGLKTARIALDGIATSDEGVAEMVQDAQDKLEKTISAGKDAVATCNGGDANAVKDNDDESDVDGTSGSDSDTSTTDASTTGDGTNSSEGSSGAGAATASSNDPLQLVHNKLSHIFGRRQIGSLRCNIARGQTVVRLGISSAAVRELKQAAGGDVDVASAADAASNGLSNAKAAIGEIAVALLTGQSAPASARDQTAQGLKDAMDALSGVDSTDSAVRAALLKAQDKVSSTIEAGEAVVSECN